ncbi:hypothetical protein Q4Q34_19530 [Flavivirga abyssicola]|uniref:DUF6913 domain-containing protein n=1 Tax=Flavivirga abyssicola TaxID=3063533 RepID=UPI0026DF1A01|nr:hypothetical protein [Flavivirga sp. MEBiC07777]WVK13409.1 hypothetical protein Q4Q34_19530 [Flavivirga sp. MEBiC07777]
MILKGFKEKSNIKHLNKLLSERQVIVTDKKIESLGVILNIDEIDDFKLFSVFADFLKIRDNKLKIVAFSENDKDTLTSWDVCFNPKDFGWKGVINNVELQTFLDTEYDALVSYYTKDVLELKMMTAKSKAQFKIGIAQEDERLNDLIIKTKLKEFDVFKEETIKYLTILNKI